MMICHAVQQDFEIRLNKDQGALLWFHEAFFNGVIEETEQGIIEAIHIEQRAGLGVQAELRPCHDFKKFLERAEAARQGDESIRQLSHERFSFVHGFNDSQIGQSAMTHFPGHKRFRNDADNFAARCQDRISKYAHKAHVATTIDERNITTRQFGSGLPCGLSINGMGTVAGAAENAEAFE